MTSIEVTRFYLVTKSTLNRSYLFYISREMLLGVTFYRSQLYMTSREVTRFYLVTKSTLYDFKRSY